jgi:para-nitrobenzyl esterase
MNSRVAAAAILALTSPAAMAQSAAPAAQAAPAAAAPAAALSTATTTIGDIIDNSAAKAIVEKYLPGFSTHPQIDMARSFTLKAVQSFRPDMISDEALAKIDADFAALAAPKSGATAG